MSEWKKVKLGDVITIKKGDYITKKTAKPGKYPVILGGQEPAYYISKYNHTGKAIVVSRSGASAGFVSKWNEPIFITDGFLIEPSNVISFDFLYYSMKNRQASLHRLQRGAAIPHVTPSLISEIEINLPDSDEQKLISDILSHYDSLIENYQRQIKLLEEATQRLYKEWFVDLHFPGYENTKIVDGVPEGWEETSIGGAFQTILGGTPSRSKTNYWNGNIAWINSGEINKNRIIAPSEYITEEGMNHSATKLLPIHATVLAITGATLGQVSYTEIETCANQSVVGIVDKDKVMPEYLFLYVKNNIQKIINKATGGAQQHINKDIVNAYPFIIPSRQIIEKFNSNIKPLFKKEAKHFFQLRLLTEARDRLLPKLMSGEIEV